MMKRKIGVVGAAALLLSMTMSSAGAHHSATAVPPTPLGCGQVVMADLTLTHNIGPCPGDGLVAGTNNITIDLDGFNIVGDGPGTESVPPTTLSPMGDAGIRIDGRTGVTVTNTSGGAAIREFNSGVFINGGSSNTVENVELTNNKVLGSNGTNVTELGDGVQLRNSSDNVITGNKVEGNEGYAGIYLVGNSDNNTINANEVKDNDETGSEVFAKQTSGIRVQFLGNLTVCPNGNVIDDNIVNANGNDGIQLFACATGNDISNNETNRNGRDGIHLFPGANDNDVYNNDARDNGFHTEGDGINVGGSLNDVTSNVVYDNHRDGISLGFCRRNLPHQNIVCPPGANNSNVAATNTIEGNWVSSNGTPTSNVQPDPTVTSTCTTLEPAPTEVDNTCDTFDEGVAHGSGIHAQRNTNANVIRGNWSTNNVVWDMLDDWGDCTHNTWTMNTFGAGKDSPACIE